MQDPYKLAEKYFKGLCSQKEAKAFLEWYFSEGGEEEIKRKIDISWPSIKKKHKKLWDSSAALKRIHLAKNRSSLFVSHKMGDDSRSKGREVITTKKVRVLSRASSILRIAVASIFILTVLGLGLLTYHLRSKDLSPQVSTYPEIIKKSNPAGQKSTIFLKDGSQIVLNSASSIQYPARFSSLERVVELHGEAFFEVATDSLRPFRVLVNNTVITALGTSFNIRSFAAEGKTIVGLVSGRVEIKARNATSENPVYLIPGEGVIHTAGAHEMEKVSIDLKKATAWKNGILYFEDEPIKDVIKTLERWYGVEFIIEQEINGVFTGKFINQSLEAVLEGLSYSFSLNYDINGKYVRLTSKYNKK